MVFQAGQALLNRTAWETDLKLLHENGIAPKMFAKRAINSGSVCYFDSYYYSKNRTPIFHNKKYENIEELVDKFREMYEAKINYDGIRENKHIFEMKLKEYLDLGIMRRATQDELKRVLIYVYSA